MQYQDDKPSNIPFLTYSWVLPQTSFPISFSTHFAFTLALTARKEIENGKGLVNRNIIYHNNYEESTKIAWLPSGRHREYKRIISRLHEN